MTRGLWPLPWGTGTCKAKPKNADSLSPEPEFGGTHGPRGEPRSLPWLERSHTPAAAVGPCPAPTDPGTSQSTPMPSSTRTASADPA